MEYITVRFIDEHNQCLYQSETYFEDFIKINVKLKSCLIRIVQRIYNLTCNVSKMTDFKNKTRPQL